jgi:hypothetical protein
MKLKTVLKDDTGVYSFEGELSEEQVTFLVTVGLNMLLARGALPLDNLVKLESSNDS